MKYIIELEDEPCMREDGLNFYKCIQVPWYQMSDSVIKRLTPYEPERKKGNWVGIDDDPCDVFECDQCGAIYETNTWDIPDYCPSCGADMRGGEME